MEYNCHGITECEILKKRTFCHGDLSLTNIIVQGGKLIYIDPSQKKEISNWLLDAAKVRASLHWLDAGLIGLEHDQRLLQYFDARFSSEELEAIKILERTHFYRVFYYARKLGRVDVANRLIAHFKATEI